MCRSTMKYVETDAQRCQRLQTKTNSLAQLIRRTFWTYYIHLPFYVITQGDAFWLHMFCLTIMSLGVFGIVKYCFLL
ncbi:TSC3 (YBR058C-A) [Zygosaccharomyces parabailii]|nr:TSC3 (YBR058C-A) [Zygosaccharomyces parabailii]